MTSSPEPAIPRKGPSVSVITVTYNAAATLEETILSVAALKGDDVEFVVVDGGSKDGTLDLLRKHEATIDTWISERDAGIYDAMNKGLELATGEYVLFLGGDDALLHVPRQELSQGADLVLGDVDCGGWTFRHLRPAAALRTRMRHRNAIHPQGTFYRRSGIRYSLEYRFCADYLYNADHLDPAAKVVYCDAAISRFCTEGASSGWPAKREAIRIARLRFGPWAGLRSLVYHLGSHLVNSLRKGEGA